MQATAAQHTAHEPGTAAAWALFAWRVFWPLALSVSVGAALLFVSRLPGFGGFQANLLFLAGINILAATSLNVVNGFTGQFSIGHAGFMGLGAYAASALMYYASLSIYGDNQFHGGLLSYAGGALSDMPSQLLTRGDLLFLGSVLLGGVVAAIAGVIVGLPSLRLRGDYLAIVTLGFGEIARVIIQGTHPQIDPFETEQLAQTPWYTKALSLGGALGFNGTPCYSTVFWTWAAVTLLLIIVLRLKYSPFGRTLVSVRDDEVAAQAMGIPVARYKVLAFVFSAFSAGIAGALLALSIGQGQITPEDLGFQRSFDIVIMVVLGGMGSVTGGCIAAVTLTVLPELLRSVEQYRMVTYAAALILIMIVRPRGLLGSRELWDLLPGRWRRRALPGQVTGKERAAS